MATYDYKCREDGYIWEEHHSIYEDAKSLGLTCPSCGSDNIFRYLGNYKTMPIKFIGPGWTINDRALDAIGMPEATRNSPEARQKLFRE